MTEIPDLSYKDVGNLYGCINWVEYARSMSKNELGWADFCLSRYESIDKWWELVSSAYLLVSLFALPWRDSNSSPVNSYSQLVINLLSQYPTWDLSKGWKKLLNNLRLISQPFI
jgi:SRSO17 transposase